MITEEEAIGILRDIRSNNHKLTDNREERLRLERAIAEGESKLKGYFRQGEPDVPHSA